MIRKIFLVFLTAILLFAACMPLLVPNDGIENPDDSELVVRLLRLALDKSELATIAGQPLALLLSKTPSFATINDVTWVSSDENVAMVDQNGNIETFFTDSPKTTVIRVYVNDDPSIYAECSVIVYPDYGSNRYWSFGPSGWYAINQNAPAANRTPIVWTNGSTNDIDIGMGMTIKGATGSGGYNQAVVSPNGLPISSGEIPPDAPNPSLYPPYPWVYTIDPDDPYSSGCNPGNNARSGLNMTAGVSGAGFAEGFLTTGGSGRILSIAAIKGPFYIEVRYHTNSNGVNRWADIRIGDKEGIRIQGEPSNHSSNAGGGKAVYYYYEDDDIIPFIYIEGAQGGAFRIHEVIISTSPPAPNE